MAIHEAGHAVAAVLLRRQFRYVTIESDESSLGHVSYAKTGIPDPEELIDERDIDRAVRKLEKIIRTALAGRAAEEIFFEKQSEFCQQDWDDSVTLAMRFYPPGDLLDAYLKYQLEWCKFLLRKRLHHRYVESVAELLLAKKKVSARAVRGTIKAEQEKIWKEFAEKPIEIVRSS